MILRLLIAEDELWLRKRLVSTIDWPSYGISEVYEAEDGSSAIELLESEQADDIDVVLMDMRMPGMDGIETTKIIRTKNGKCMEVPIIAMTADGFETDIGMLQKAGMNGLISKPVDVNTLVEHITKLAGW